MLEQFTDRARRVVVLAQAEAGRLGHDFIGTEHLLLGLLDEGGGVGGRALDALGVTHERALAEVEKIVGRGSGSPQRHIPFTDGAKKVLELSLREAVALGHDHIGTEHILLGMVRLGYGAGYEALVNLNVDLEQVKPQVVATLTEVPQATQRAPLITGTAQRVHTKAMLFAESLHQERTGSEHFFLALLSLSDAGAVKFLREEGVDVDGLEARLTALLKEAKDSADP